MGGGGWEELAVVGGAELGGRGALDCYRNKILNKAHHTKGVFGGVHLLQTGWLDLVGES